MQKSVRMPRPVSKRSINKQGKQRDENYIRRKSHALGNGTCDESGSYNCEFKLEKGVEEEGDGCRKRGIGRFRHPPQHEMRKRVPDNSVIAFSKSQAESDDNPQNAYQTHCYKTLKHCRYNIFRTYHAAIKK